MFEGYTFFTQYPPPSEKVHFVLRGSYLVPKEAEPLTKLKILKVVLLDERNPSTNTIKLFSGTDIFLIFLVTDFGHSVSLQVDKHMFKTFKSHKKI